MLHSFSSALSARPSAPMRTGQLRFAGEAGSSSRPHKMQKQHPSTKEKQGADEPQRLFRSGIYEPLLERHGQDFLREATSHYIKAEDAPSQAQAFSWIHQLLNRNVSPNTHPSEIPLINLAINRGKQRLSDLFRQFGVFIAPKETRDAAQQRLFDIMADPSEEVRFRQFSQNGAIFLTPGLNLAQPYPRSASQRTLLHWAAHDQAPAFLRTLLQSAVPPNLPAENGTPLEEAIVASSLEAVKELIQAGADVNRIGINGLPPLMLALKMNRYPSAKEILNHGANPNIPAPITGDTPLHFATLHGNTEMVKRLLEKGADANHRNKVGSTPLLKAVRQGLSSIAQQLLDYNADPNQTDDEGNTLLFNAAGLGGQKGPPILNLLLTHGVNPNLRGRNGKTPLIRAIEENKPKNVRTLVLGVRNADRTINAADVNLADVNGVKPLTWAFSTGDDSIIEILRRHGATF